MENMEKNILDELISHIGSLASVYHKPPSAFLNNFKKKQSNASASASTDLPQKSEVETIQAEM